MVWDEPSCSSSPSACRTAEVADVLFLVGQSQGAGRESSRLVKDFIGSMARSFENVVMGKGGIRLAVALYGEKPRWVNPSCTTSTQVSTALWL